MDTQRLEKALIAAHQAGDVEAAKQFAAALRGAQQPKYDPSAGGGTLSFGPWDTGIKTPQFVDRALAGAGKFAVDAARGIGQLTGLKSQEDIDEAKALDAPLM